MMFCCVLRAQPGVFGGRLLGKGMRLEKYNECLMGINSAQSPGHEDSEGWVRDSFLGKVAGSWAYSLGRMDR